MRRLVQSLLLIALCVLIAGAIGGIYLGAVVVTLGLAVSSGVYVLTAIGLGLMWPVLVLAYVLHVTSRAQLARTMAESAPRTARTGQVRSGVEDPEHRQ